jgi:hypothetical protein
LIDVTKKFISGSRSSDGQTVESPAIAFAGAHGFGSLKRLSNAPTT